MYNTEQFLPLQKRVIQVFSNVEYPGDENIVSPGERDPETQAVSDVFRGKHWNEVSLNMLRENEGCIWFFTPKALQYYLPAYLLTALDLDGVWSSGMSLIRVLSPSPYGIFSENDLLSKIKLNIQQREVIRIFFELLGKEFPELFDDELHRQTTIGFWSDTSQSTK